MLWVLQSCSAHCDTRYWSFGFARNTFLSTIFIVINVLSWNEINLDTHNNLHSFWCGHYNYVLLIVIHNIDALGLQENLTFPPFSLQSKFFSQMRQTWILTIIFILFVMGTTIMFSSSRYTILMLWICKKRFSFHYFHYN